MADDFDSLCADRAAIERVYYNHRLGTKPPFEETLPRATLEKLVRLDLHKEAALKEAYGMTPAQLAAEVQRINTTTQSPEMLAEIKAALGHDPEKFANAFAKPILVERELRQRFDNDDALHATTRREMERVRSGLTNAAAEFRRSRDNEALIAKSESGKQKAEIDQSLLTSAATKGLSRSYRGMKFAPLPGSTPRSPLRSLSACCGHSRKISVYSTPTTQPSPSRSHIWSGMDRRHECEPTADVCIRIHRV